MKEFRTILGSVYERFAQQAPVAVMVRASMERCLSPQVIDEVFEQTARAQYTRRLLFSSTFTVLCEAVCRVHPSVHAAYQAHQPEMAASVVALYDKLKGIEPAVLTALVRRSAQELGPVLEATGGALVSPLPGRPVRILDGSWLEASQRRLGVLRPVQDAPLPGKALVVLDPARMLALEMIPCEDGHAQERQLLPAAGALVQAGELWIADRNLCTLGWVEAVDRAAACFIVRQHARFPVEPLEAFRPVGRGPTGEVSEQAVRVRLPEGQVRQWRRVRLVLDRPTRDGARELYLVTNLPVAEADALRVAELYRGRWTIERLFQEIEATLQSEINTLAYPRAALFGLAIGLVAHNTLALVKAAMRAAHGVQTVETQVSGYYLATELESTSRGLDIAVPPATWAVFGQMEPPVLAQELVRLAGGMCLARYRKHPRGPKKPQPPRHRLGRAQGSHVSTARLLAAAKRSRASP